MHPIVVSLVTLLDEMSEEKENRSTYGTRSAKKSKEIFDFCANGNTFESKKTLDAKTLNAVPFTGNIPGKIVLVS